MSLTVRLEGLSSSASSRDIRGYFSGLEIPLGGVTVIGGKRGEAFVNFIKWDDARQAILQTGRPLKDSTIHVSLSSREEMERALQYTEILSKTSVSDKNGTHEERNRDERDAVSLRTHVYLRIKVSASEATLTDIQRFFNRLHIIDVLYFKDERSVRSGDAIVKFASNVEATEGFNRYRDSKSIRVSWSSEGDWLKYGGIEDDSRSRHGRKRTRSRSPRKRSRSPRRRSRSPLRRSRSPLKRSRSPLRRSRSPRRRSRSPRKRSRSPRKRSRSPRRRSKSPRRRSRSPRRRSRSSGRRSRSSGRRSRSLRRRSRSSGRRSRSPRKRSKSPGRRSRSERQCSRSSSRHSKSPESQSDENSSNSDEFHVRVLNVSNSVEKSDLKKLFYNYVSDSNITFVHDEKGHRTRECFVMFSSDEHRKKVLRFDKCMFKGRTMYISSISKSRMQKLLAENKAMSSQDFSNGQYFYLRNFPSNVSKSDVQEFFSGFSLKEGDIYLLCDKKGVPLGEVLVNFTTKEEVTKADKLNRKKFKGKEIPLKRIPEEKLKSILRYNSVLPGSTDPYDCVTQEDDTLEDNDLTQEDGSSEDKRGKTDLYGTQDASTADNDFFQIDHECVTQADDVDDEPIEDSDTNAPNEDSDTNADIKHEDTSFIQADSAPNDESDTHADIKHEDKSAIQADIAPNDESDTHANIKQEDKSAIQADNVPNDDSDTHADIKQEDKSAIQADNAPNDDSDTHADIKQEDKSAIQADNAPNDDSDTHADIKQEEKSAIQANNAPNDDSDTHADIKHEGKCLIQADDAHNEVCVTKVNSMHGNETINDKAME
ncbi:RNA-binding protein 12B-A-like [Pseudophryne corroboree]|uniref:RNA-binding protein 12B-A-like n=1 Tax=Pseudophryne corroboree TaxID=495146 RepID=UPI003081F521